MKGGVRDSEYQSDWLEKEQAFSSVFSYGRQSHQWLSRFNVTVKMTPSNVAGHGRGGLSMELVLESGGTAETLSLYPGASSTRLGGICDPPTLRATTALCFLALCIVQRRLKRTLSVGTPRFTVLF